MDRSLIESGWLYKLNKLNIDIHVRSIFLQGLLLMAPESLPKKFSKFMSLWLEWHLWLEENKFSALEGCLAYINSVQGLSGVLIGVETCKQLDEIIAASNSYANNIPNWSEQIDPNLVNPSLWSSL
jgi:aryl-alcohol dehydrogenase-like predicted oxidoreductase